MIHRYSVLLCCRDLTGNVVIWGNYRFQLSFNTSGVMRILHRSVVVWRRYPSHSFSHLCQAVHQQVQYQISVEFQPEKETICYAPAALPGNAWCRCQTQQNCKKSNRIDIDVPLILAILLWLGNIACHVIPLVYPIYPILLWHAGVNNLLLLWLRRIADKVIKDRVRMCIYLCLMWECEITYV